MSAKPKPTPHNPDNVTPAQLQQEISRDKSPRLPGENPVKFDKPRKGGKRWRLLDVTEIKNRRLSPHIECINEFKHWTNEWCGNSLTNTYRTRLTRAELAKLK